MELTELKGIGKATIKKLNSNNIYSVTDLITTLPLNYDILKLSDSYLEKNALISVKVVSRPVSLKIRYNNNMLIFFGEFANIKIKFIVFGMPYLLAKLKINTNIMVYGNYNLEKRHFLVKNVFFEAFNLKIIPYYKLNDIPDSIFSKLVKEAFKNTLPPVERLPKEIVSKYRFLDYASYLLKSHFPTTLEDVKQLKRRKIYEKFYYYTYVSESIKCLGLNINKPKKIFSMTSVYDFINKLPFTLTSDQLKAILEIKDDLSSNHKMNRLVVGDVSSGKTIVAFIASYMAYLANYQVAFMAPTEILAWQHYKNILNYFKKEEVALLVSSLKEKERKNILDELVSGKIKIVIGTHALIQDTVNFNNLGLLIVDEQQRFGVLQRSYLQKKYNKIDTLYLTATPIPRTLLLTFYNDLDVSLIKQMPYLKREVVTKVINEQKLNTILPFLKSEIEAKKGIFVVVPLITESETLDCWDIPKALNYFKDELKINVKAIHGKTKKDEVNLVINEFNINCDILLMTSWDLNLYNLNFVFETNSLETKILSSDEIYISDKLADKLLDEGKNYDDLLDTSIDCETMRSSTSSIVNRNFKIKGIVDTDNESSNIIKYKFVDTENLVIMSYPSVVNVFTQLKYCFIMYESFLSINYVLGRITDYVSNHEIYETCIFDYDANLNQLLIGESNIYYHNTINSHNPIWIRGLLIVILLLLIVFHFGLLFQYMIFKHGSYETRLFFYFLTFAIPTIFLIILFLFCPYVISSGVVFSTINSNFIIFYLLLMILAVPYCYKIYVINVLKNKFTCVLLRKKIEEREIII